MQAFETYNDRPVGLRQDATTINMKKLSLLIILLSLPLIGWAQPGSQEIKATAGGAYAVKHETYTPSFENDGSTAEVRNVILMIGDGMGVGAVNAAMYINGGTLTLTNLKTCGFVRTQSANSFTTDSAASGTAYATGVKTNNGFLGISPQLDTLANLPEKLTPLGYACGVISTDDLNGGTPASFFAHQRARGASEAIWEDLATCSLVFASAGTRSVYESLPLKTQDSIAKEFKVVYSPEAEGIAESGKLIYLPESVQYAERGNYLAETTEMAIQYLSERSDKGFFLMVEGARIDKESHENDFQGMVNEMLDFDKAVEAAIRFAEQDGHTLVIISADHETGAVSLSYNTEFPDGYIAGVFGAKGHTPIMVPLFAYGPHSRDFSGTQENSDVSNKIFGLLGGE